MAKYLIINTTKEGELSVLFEDIIGHDDMLKMIKSKHKDAVAVSAGFWLVDNERNIKCYGKSVSLNIASRDIDSLLITMRYLGNLK